MYVQIAIGECQWRRQSSRGTDGATGRRQNLIWHIDIIIVTGRNDSNQRQEETILIKDRKVGQQIIAKIIWVLHDTKLLF